MSVLDMSKIINLLNKNLSSSDDQSVFSANLFDLAPEVILFIDKKGRVIRANKRVEEWLGYSSYALNGTHISALPFIYAEDRKEIKSNFKKRISGESVSPYEIRLKNKKGMINIGRVSGSPVKDEHGNNIGAIIMVSNATEIKKVSDDEKMLNNDLRLLAETASGLVELPHSSDIYQYIGERLHLLMGKNQVSIQKYNSEKNANQTCYYFGASKGEEKMLKSLKKWPIGEEYILQDDAKKTLLKRKIVELKDKAYDLFQGKISRPVARALELFGGIDRIYVMGFAWEGELFGSANAIIRKGSKFREESVNAFLQQASVAIQKRRADDALQKAHDELEIKVEERTADLKQSNQDLEKFKLAVKDASDHIIITDPKGHIIFANAAAERITGYSYAQMQGKTPALWGKQMGDDFYKKFWNTINSKKPFLGEIRNKRSGDVEYWAEIHVSPVLDSDNNIQFFVGIERDITKAKEVDQAKTEFVSLASHQLRTPLSAINWYTEMLLAGDAGDITTDQESYLKEIYNGSQRMVDLVNALLNVSRLELGTFIVEPTEGSLQEIADDVLKELENQTIAKKQQIVKDYDTGIPKIMIDTKLTRIVFQNLLSNAVKYTPEEGKVTVSIITNPDNHKEVLIKVKDTGYGIPKYQQDKIFSKLFRADNIKKMETEGTGLGVYIIKQIIDNAGGKIWFESEENKGSTFYVTIPLSGMVKKAGSRELS
jgi:PAS domain S-box-containing protein